MLTKWLIGWPEQQLGCLLYPLFGFLLSNPPPLLYNLCLAILAMKLMDDFLQFKRRSIYIYNDMSFASIFYIKKIIQQTIYRLMRQTMRYLHI
jgi:hypothetical protein